MYNQPYFIPRYFSSTVPSMMRSPMNGAMGRAMSGAIGNTMNGARLATQGASRGLGLFSRLGNSMQIIKSINWGGLITNASKTLNVVNQAIPLVRQVGPMVNNMKSMLKIASIFKDETDKTPVSKRSQTTDYSNSNNSSNTFNSQERSTTNRQNSYSYSDYYDNSPTFFINS